MALTGMGPQQYTPKGRSQCRNKDDRATFVRIFLDQNVLMCSLVLHVRYLHFSLEASGHWPASR